MLRQAHALRRLQLDHSHAKWVPGCQHRQSLLGFAGGTWQIGQSPGNFIKS